MKKLLVLLLWAIPALVFAGARAPDDLTFFARFPAPDSVFPVPRLLFGVLFQTDFVQRSVPSLLALCACAILLTGTRSVVAALAFPILSLTVSLPYEEMWSLPLVAASAVLAGQAGMRAVAGLFVIAIIWANSCVGFAVLPALLFVDLLVPTRSRSDTRRDRLLRLFAVMLGVCLTPGAGFGGAWALLGEVFSADESARTLGRFVTPDFHVERGYLLCLALLVVTLGVREAASKEKARAALSILLLFVSPRFAPLIFVVTALSTARALRARISDEGEEERSLILIGMAGIGSIFIVAAALLTGDRSGANSLKPLLLGLAAEKRLPVFNDLRTGAELSSLGLPYFIREPASELLFTREGQWRLREYQRLLRLQPGWEEVLKRYSFGTAIVRADSSLRTILVDRLGWRIRAESDSAWFVTPLKTSRDRYLLLVQP